MKTAICACMVCTIVCGWVALTAQEIRGQFQHERSGTEHIQYLLTIPAGLRGKTAGAPVIVFLHGGSGRGDDLALVKQYGPELKAKHNPSFPFVVLSPQCRKGEIWTDVDALRDLIQDVVSEYQLDSARVYLTGMSMGGRGTWYMAYRNPDMFAAIAPLAAFQTITDTWPAALIHIPVWAFHGQMDPMAPLVDDEQMVNGINEAGGHAQLTIVKAKGHDITDIYEQDALYTWFLSHRRSTRADVRPREEPSSDPKWQFTAQQEARCGRGDPACNKRAASR